MNDEQFFFPAVFPEQLTASQKAGLSAWRRWREDFKAPLPWDAHVLFAYAENWRALTRPAAAGLPPRWRTPLFRFVWWCKAHPATTSFDPERAVAAIGEVIATWPRPPEAADADPWRYWFATALAQARPDAAATDPVAEAWDLWEAIRHPPGAHALTRAKVLADERPLGGIKGPPSAEYRRFVSIAGWLQTLIDGPILLPVQILGDALGVHWTSISRYLRAAQQAGYLTRLSPHRYSQRLAAEWAFDCGRFAELGEGRP